MNNKQGRMKPKNPFLTVCVLAALKLDLSFVAIESLLFMNV